MIHVLKQSMLTYIFDCLLLVRYTLLYQYRFEQQTCIKERKWKKIIYLREEFIYKLEKKKRKIMPMGGREPAYQKTLKYAVRERGETNWAIPTLQV